MLFVFFLFEIHIFLFIFVVRLHMFMYNLFPVYSPPNCTKNLDVHSYCPGSCLLINKLYPVYKFKFYDNYLLSANNWAGMGLFSIGAGDSSLTHLADVEVKGWVKQISLWNDIAVLSCGENGIFLVDLSDPANPKVDQPIDAGYTYRTHVAGDIIYAATREGVKRYHIESR